MVKVTVSEPIDTGTYLEGSKIFRITATMDKCVEGIYKLGLTSHIKNIWLDNNSTYFFKSGSSIYDYRTTRSFNTDMYSNDEVLETKYAVYVTVDKNHFSIRTDSKDIEEKFCISIMFTYDGIPLPLSEEYAKELAIKTFNVFRSWNLFTF